MEDRTQMMGGQTILGGSQPTILAGSQTQMGFDPQRTQMAPSMQTLSLECLPGNRYAATQGSPNNHALLLIKATGNQLGRRTPLNICLAIDRSGSMEGEPLEYVKRACEHVVDMLEPTDILSIVTFDEDVQVLMTARRVVNKELVKDHIRRIYVGTTTNIYDGLMADCLQVSTVMNQAAGYVHRVLLLTDGEPTAGLKDYNSIVQAVAEQKTRGISVTALGFGSEYNEELMAGIARRSGGNYYYIQRPDLLPEVFRRELEQLMTIVAKNVRVRFHLSKWVQHRQVYGLQAEMSSRGFELEMPDIERGTVRTVLAEMNFERHPSGTFRVAKIEVAYDDIVSNRAERASVDCVFEFTKDQNLVMTHYNAIVRNELEIAQASLNLQRTMMGVRTQQITAMGAVTELQRTRTILMQAGQVEQAQSIDSAMQSIQRGNADVEKTIIGTIYNLDQGKRQ